MSKWKDDRVLQVVNAFLLSKHTGSISKTYDQIATEMVGLFPRYTFTGEAVRAYWKILKLHLNLSSEKVPRILLFDIETLPIQCYSWRLGKQVIYHTQLIKDWCILSWAAKWLNDSDYYSEILTSQQAVARNDKPILKGIWDLLEEADIVIGHNSFRFDHRMLNARFLLHQMKPTTPFTIIDTLKQSRQIAGFTSHKLDYLGLFLKNKTKIETDFKLWIACDKGNQEALVKMLKYNIHDVSLLEEIYYELRPWMKSHPNTGIYVESEESVCAVCCASTDLLEWKGTYVTMVGKYASYRCKGCGAIGRSRVSTLDKDKKKVLTISMAK